VLGANQVLAALYGKHHLDVNLRVGIGHKAIDVDGYGIIRLETDIGGE
jgi:hypothetical protein